MLRVEITGGLRSWVEWPRNREGCGEKDQGGRPRGWQKGITHISLKPVIFLAFGLHKHPMR